VDGVQQPQHGFGKHHHACRCNHAHPRAGAQRGSRRFVGGQPVARAQVLRDDHAHADTDDAKQKKESGLHVVGHGEGTRGGIGMPRRNGQTHEAHEDAQQEFGEQGPGDGEQGGTRLRRKVFAGHLESAFLSASVAQVERQTLAHGCRAQRLPH
jgi:hypothetical protein